MRYILIMTALLGQSGVFHWDSEPQYVGTEIRYQLVSGTIASTTLGPAAPGFGTCGSLFGQIFTAPAEQSYHASAALPCWDGINDIKIGVFFTNEQGDALEDGETIIFNFEYRTVGLFTADTGLAGNAVTKVVTYTQVNAGLDCQALYVEDALDKGDGDQPYVYGDSIVGTFSAAGSYSGDPVVGNVFFMVPYKQTCRIS